MIELDPGPDCSTPTCYSARSHSPRCAAALAVGAVSSYLVRRREVAAGGGGLGEIAKVTQAFQPSGRCSAANSL